MDLEIVWFVNLQLDLLVPGLLKNTRVSVIINNGQKYVSKN